MNIVVCLKQTLDPEIPPKDFKIDPATKKPIQGKAKSVMDSYAENALEVAIQLKEKTGSKVTLICVGDKSSDEVLKRGLAFTADEAIRIWDDSFVDMDARALAYVLACTIENIGGADLVLTGRQAADFERGSVGPMLAEELKSGCVTFVAKVEPEENGVKLTREVDGGFEIIESKLPLVLTVTSHEANVPRLPKVRDTMMAMRKLVSIKTVEELRLSVDSLESNIEITEVYVPKQEGKCEFIDGDEGSDKAINLATKLRKMKLI